MNIDNQRFLELNGINPDELRKKIDCQIYSQEAIDNIIYHYGFQTQRRIKMISVADIVGHAYMREGKVKDIFESMDDFFDSNGDVYHSRSLGMLSLDSDTIMDKLGPSLERNPLHVNESGNSSYLITEDGFHRFTILRVMYLKELYEANGDPKKIEELRKKYTIPASVMGIDVDETYSKFILSFIGTQDPSIYIKDMERYYDPDTCIPTEDILVTYEKENCHRKSILSRDEFIMLAKRALLKCPKDEPTFKYIKDALDENKGFREFVSRICPEYFTRADVEERGV